MVHEMDNQPTPDAILALGRGYWASQTLLSAVEFGVFTVIAEHGPIGTDALRGHLGLHPRGARDFFDALVSLRMLERDTEGRYGNTAATAQYLDRAKPETYLGGPFEMANARLYGFWGRLPEALRSGLPQNELRGADGSVFPTLHADPAKQDVFLRAMTSNSLAVAPGIAAGFPWEAVRSVADLGCACGGFLTALVRAHPHLTGIGFDMPQAGGAFDRYVAAAGHAGRLRFVAGDFFSDPLPEADVLVMGHILHDWSPLERQALLRRACAALPAGGRLLVYDLVLDDERRDNSAGLLMSLNMLINTTAGSEYTAAECQDWMREAGFREATTTRLPRGYAMIVGTK